MIDEKGVNMNPIMLINFKVYRNGTGKNAIMLATIADSVALETSANIGVVVESPSIYIISKSVTIPVFSQHIDLIENGPYTGHMLPESVKDWGAYGTIINHSEKNIEFRRIGRYIERAKEAKLRSVVCVSKIHEARKAAEFYPDYIALEEPSLISSGKSISAEMPRTVEKFSEAVRECDPLIKTLCGAGIANAQDVKYARKLGMDGVLVSSAIVNFHNPKEKIMELASALQAMPDKL